jgi:KaiC/GvpD/RAD55 family RecA-like ATPase
MEDLQFLYSERENKFLSDLGTLSYSQSRRESIVEHNLPDKNFICSNFVGRESILNELWRWFGEPLSYAKLLAGDGGKGKTSIAYEFADQVCRAKPYNIEKVIWLTAKSKQFIGIIDDYRSIPETHFQDTESLLKAICSELAVMDEEIEGVSVRLLEITLKNALSTISCLVVIDDVDSTELEQQKMILETAMRVANPNARFLLTTRMNFSYSIDTCIRIEGMEPEEYTEYVQSLLDRHKLPRLSKSRIEKMRTTTDGSPLFTESLVRLRSHGMNFDEALKDWQGKMGSEVRVAALEREIKLF